LFSTVQFDSALTSKPSWQQVWDLVADDVKNVCDDVTKFLPLEARDLERLLLLHLPRFAADDIRLPSTIRNEATRLLADVLLRRRDYDNWTKYPKIAEFVKGDVGVSECCDQTAQVIYERFHYIGGCRQGIIHLGLFYKSRPEIPMAVMTVSEMDIAHLRDSIRLRPFRPLIVSRSFAFDWAPRNSLSFLTAQVRRWLRRNRPEVDILLTYVNPNIGFRGTSYAASGWWEFGNKDIIYRYFKDRYLSYRMSSGLTPEERHQTTTSQVQLVPLRILATQVKR
jgi:hypothetical protein